MTIINYRIAKDDKGFHPQLPTLDEKNWLSLRPNTSSWAKDGDCHYSKHRENPCKTLEEANARIRKYNGIIFPKEKFEDLTTFVIVK